ncbi:uncharacterized protein [Clytia hemisphaerica]|uniref:Uncharacterized protein n=1 Tax=Clytia hemisphaerica TaxID=252671 RepID=A0A7M5WY51_9CNID
MSSDKKNSNKTTIFDGDVESVTTETKDGRKSKNLSLTIKQGAAAKKTKVQVWLGDSSEGTDDVGISLKLEKRNMTCPDINTMQIQQQDKATPAPRNVHSLSLYQTQSTTRKSFLGELKNILTFNKKQDDSPLQDAPSAHVTVEKEFEKENKKVALQNRRKQVFQNPEEPENNDLSTFSTVGVTINKLQASLKKWKIKKNTEEVRDTIAVNVHHQKILDDWNDKMQTEIPFPLQIIMKEEALEITTRVHHMYKSMLGSKHTLTKEAEHHNVLIMQSLYVPDIKPNKD